MLQALLELKGRLLVEAALEELVSLVAGHLDVLQARPQWEGTPGRGRGRRVRERVRGRKGQEAGCSDVMGCHLTLWTHTHTHMCGSDERCMPQERCTGSFAGMHV